jgi:hypothetical protein
MEWVGSGLFSSDASVTSFDGDTELFGAGAGQSPSLWTDALSSTGWTPWVNLGGIVGQM